MPNVLSPRDIVSGPDNMDETVLSLNKIHHIYNAMVVLHICKRILGIPLPG